MLWLKLTVECTVIDERAHGSINGHRLPWLCRWQCISFQCKIVYFSPFANCTVILMCLGRIAAAAIITNGKLFVQFIRACISLFFAIKQKWIVVLWHCAYLFDMHNFQLCGRQANRLLNYYFFSHLIFLAQREKPTMKINRIAFQLILLVARSMYAICVYGMGKRVGP